jgi:hypothetical protein
VAERRRSHQHQAAVYLARRKRQATPADPPHHPPLARVDNDRCLAGEGRSSHDKQPSRPNPLHGPGASVPSGMRAGQAHTPQRTPTAHVKQLHAAARLISDRHETARLERTRSPKRTCSVWVGPERRAEEPSAGGGRADPARSPRRGERVRLHAAVRRRPQVAMAPQAPRRQRQAHHYENRNPHTTPTLADTPEVLSTRSHRKTLYEELCRCFARGASVWAPRGALPLWTRGRRATTNRRFLPDPGGV